MISLLLSGVLAWGQTNVPTPRPAPDANALLDAIRTAPDPSATIQAYARGVVAAGPVHAVEIHRAYVQRMFALGAPELADAQAHELIDRGAADATVRGIAAYNDALRGNARAAIYNLKVGLAARSDDPFLLRTAGQIVAWYDAQAGRSKLAADDIAGIEFLRTAGNGRQAFADAYRASADARRPQTQSAATVTTATTPATAMAATQPSMRSSAGAGSSNSAASYQGAASTGYSTSEGYKSSYPYSSYGYGSSYPYGYYGYSSSYGYVAGAAAADSLLTPRDRDFQHAAQALDPRGGLPGDGIVNPANRPGPANMIPPPPNPANAGSPPAPYAGMIPQAGGTGASPPPSPYDFRMPQGPPPGVQPMRPPQGAPMRPPGLPPAMRPPSLPPRPPMPPRPPLP
jgi:hypothetical protein